MKTIEQRDNAIHNWAMVGLLAFFTFAWCTMDHEALPHLLHALKSSWLELTDWAASGMMNPHRIHC